jgi:hypothetical protein
VADEVVDSLEVLFSQLPAMIGVFFTFKGYKYAPDLAAEFTICFALSKSPTLLLISLVILHCLR